MNEQEKLTRIEELSEENVNIIDQLSNGRTENTTVMDEMISYDIRAGVNTREYEEDPDFTIKVSKRILQYINGLGLENYTVLECGCGEGTKIVNIVNAACGNISWACGIDISWSRLKYAMEFNNKYGIKKDLTRFYMADMFSLPFLDTSVDIVYTMQGIYAMGGREKQLVKELYRVTSKYLILIEPSYEMANDEARARMVHLNYVKGLKHVAEEYGNVVKYEQFGVDSNPQNPAAVIIIEKNQCIRQSAPVSICDPITHAVLNKTKGVYFSYESKLSYPIIDGIPCLTPSNAILTSKLV